jgi:hypothetical protein
MVNATRLAWGLTLLPLLSVACGTSATPAITDAPDTGTTPCTPGCDDPDAAGTPEPASDAGVPFDGGGGVDGSVSPDGGTLTRLLFASVGDTRGATPDYLPAYPTDTITKIFTSIQAMSPRPAMVVSTGDYAFTLTGADTSAQLDLYLGARSKFTGAFFPGMGNHECIFQNDRNCGPGNADGTTKAYQAFVTKMLGTVGKTDPYYAVNVNAADGTWTAKFVFVAPNAWNAAQATWLNAAMAVPTTYTFVVRHQPIDATNAPAGLAASDAITSKFPYTLALVGHSHSYRKNGPKEVLFGNAGAPLTGAGTKQFGYGVFSQRADGAIQVDAIQVDTGLADSTFRFAVKPDGTVAP